MRGTIDKSAFDPLIQSVVVFSVVAVVVLLAAFLVVRLWRGRS